MVPTILANKNLEFWRSNATVILQAPILSPLDEYRILATAAGESDILNPLSCAETAAMIQELVEGMETQEKFKGGNFYFFTLLTVLKMHEISFLSQKQNEFTSWLCRIIDNLILNY